MNVTVTVDPAKLQPVQGGTRGAEDEQRGCRLKADGLLGERLVDLANARFSAALNDGSDSRYAFRTCLMAAGRPPLTLSRAAIPKSMFSLIFGSSVALPLAGITYSTPLLPMR